MRLQVAFSLHDFFDWVCAAEGGEKERTREWCS
jgi:hypothetical protein